MDPFVAEIRIFGFNFAPTGWAQCNGQLLPISQNTALFSLLGTYYGGNGQSTFALPNLQNSAHIGAGQGAGLSVYDVGQTGGEASLTLLQTEMPQHNHNPSGKASGGLAPATSNVWGTAGTQRPAPNFYQTAAGNTQMNPLALSLTGGNLPHNNLMPYMVLNFCIALQGVFPPRS